MGAGVGGSNDSSNNSSKRNTRGVNDDFTDMLRVVPKADPEDDDGEGDFAPRVVYTSAWKSVPHFNNTLVRRVYNLVDRQIYLFLNAVLLSAIYSARARQGGLRVLRECNGAACFRSPSSMSPLSLGIRRRRLASANTQHLPGSDRTRCHRRLAPQRGAP